MSIKLSLLALLAEQPAYGAQLRATFEERTGGTWPLNIGQVYTTLDRLTRDGLVVADPPQPDGTTAYRLTAAGEEEVRRWWAEPVQRERAPRSELAIKLALAVTAPGVDVAAVVQSQRTATLQHLQELTRLRRHADDDDVAWRLVLENLIFAAEAEARWLDHVEGELARRAQRKPAAPSRSTGTPATGPAPAPTGAGR